MDKEISSLSPSSVDVNTNKKKREALPLGWTRVKRQRTRLEDGTNGNTSRNKDNREYACCDDPLGCSAFSSSRTLLRSPVTAAMSGTNDSSVPCIRGWAIFCLHELDCAWFQGHFFPSTNRITSKKALGLLATLNDTDMEDCMGCCTDGGYQELDLSIIRHRPTPRKALKLPRLCSTGGDMMRMRNKVTVDHNNNNDDAVQLEFDTQQIITGPKSTTYMQTYFSALLKRLSPSSAQDGVEMLPDCAILVGPMKLSGDGLLDFFKNTTGKKEEGNDDGWLSD